MGNYTYEIVGGLLIGFASAIPLIWEGRIAGISGYAESAIKIKSSDGKNALLLIIGLVLGSLLWRILGAENVPVTSNDVFPLWVWGITGLLVGLGSRMAGGCTSGHGVCGLGRTSPRSLASVGIFMSAAILTSILMRKFL